MFLFYLKGGLIVSFFLWACGGFAAEQAIDSRVLYTQEKIKTISKKSEWLTLLHSQHNKSFVRDPKFFFHRSSFDPEQELIATLRGFQQATDLGDNHPICQFPGRFIWLKKELELQDNDFPRPPCNEYQIFLKKVPVDEVELVFASENVISPSSMMGHVFLKLSGINEKGLQVQHAVTYFTVLDSLNIPKIVYQNLAGGMKGYFALQPYQRLLSNYLDGEQRNLWEYSIVLSKEKKNLLRAHIWELKNIEADYLFVEYNCATVTRFLLGLAVPNMLNENQPYWVTPIDVIKQAERYKLIERTQVITSDRWKLKMLLDQTDISSIGFLRELNSLSPQRVDEYIREMTSEKRLLLLTYFQYLKKHDEETSKKTLWVYQRLESFLQKNKVSFRLDYSKYKQPTKAPGNSQIQLTLGTVGGKGFVGISLLPTANRITDDQRQFFSTRELKIAEINLRLYEGGIAKLHELTLYAVSSLNPWNALTQNISAQWRTGLEEQLDGQLNTHLVYNLSGGLGYSFLLGNDITLHGLYNIGAATDLVRSYLYQYPEVGLQIKEIWDMKTFVRFESKFNSYQSHSTINKLDVCQSYYPHQNASLSACYIDRFNKQQHQVEVSIAYQLHF